MRRIVTLLSQPGVIVYSVCALASIIQFGILCKNYAEPTETITTTAKKNLSEIDFPIDFKICLKPGFNQSALTEAGYADVTDYFTGASRYNSSLAGWAGHTPQGNPWSNATGRISSVTESQLFSDAVSALYDTLSKVLTRPPTDIIAAIRLVHDK